MIVRLILAGSRVQFKSKGFRAFSFSEKGDLLILWSLMCHTDPESHSIEKKQYARTKGSSGRIACIHYDYDKGK